MIRPIALLAASLFFLSVHSQPVEQRLKIVVAPDHANWLYHAGEHTKFSITVLAYGNAPDTVTIHYEIGPERMEPAKKGTMLLKKGTAVLDGGTLTQPGFLRCIVTVDADGQRYRNLATTGYDVSSILPIVKSPDDFSAFWKDGIDALSKVPIDARRTLLPERCTEKVNVYEVNLQNFGNTRFYGILCVPKAPGKYPAILNVPGAGVRSYRGDISTAENGFITLDVGIHGIPVTLDEKVYESLRAGILRDYYNYNLDNRDRYYYKRVYLGCIRANDYLCSLPEFDGVHLGVKGGSQGGALAIVTAALDPRVKAAVSMYPALSDIPGYLAGRAGGWPHLLDKTNLPYNNTKEKLATIPYYDVVNFAKLLKIPIKMSWGYNDEVCPPTTSYAVYNSIASTKSLDLYLDTGHWGYSEQYSKMLDWMTEQLKGN